MSVPIFARAPARERLGFKGPRAAAWLAAQGMAIPPASNTWIMVDGIMADRSRSNDSSGTPEGVLIARLGATEFFLEDRSGGGSSRGDGRGVGGNGSSRGVGSGSGVGGASDPCGLRGFPSPQGIAGVYPVLREDAAFELAGARASHVLAQVCDIDFSQLDLVSRPVVMTLMAAVSVLVLALVSANDRGPRYQIWCDPTFGVYLEHTLAEIVIECGGIFGGAAA